MNKEFIPYEQALELKQLGFDEECIAIYVPYLSQSGWSLSIDVAELHLTNRILQKGFSAPLYQQAFRWFRDNKLSDSCICRYQSRDDGGIYYYYVINHDFGIEEIRHFKEGFISYEEAELACIKKLIEIVKNK